MLVLFKIHYNSYRVFRPSIYLHKEIRNVSAMKNHHILSRLLLSFFSIFHLALLLILALDNSPTNLSYSYLLFENIWRL